MKKLYKYKLYKLSGIQTENYILYKIDLSMHDTHDTVKPDQTVLVSTNDLLLKLCPDKQCRNYSIFYHIKFNSFVTIHNNDVLQI